MKDFKIIGYTRPNDDWRKPSTYHTKDIANTVHSFTGGGWNTDQFVLEYEEDMKDYKVIGQSHRRRESPDSCYIEKDICKTIDTFSGTETHGGLFVVEREEDMKKNDLSRAESMVFEEQPDGGLRGIRTNNGLTASEWYVNGEDTECVPNLRAKGEAKVVTRKDGIRFKQMSDGNIRGYRSDKHDKRGVSEYCVGTESTSVCYEQTTSGQLKYLHGGRMRKLTPRECFRLMNVDEANIDKIQAAGISETQQYKLAGNSIVVNVLAEIFRKLFIDTEPESGQQLSLF